MRGDVRGEYLRDRLLLRVTGSGSIYVARSNLNGIEIVNGMGLDCNGFFVTVTNGRDVSWGSMFMLGSRMVMELGRAF